MLTDNFVTMEIGKAKHIALVAHDGKKKELIEWCDRNKRSITGTFPLRNRNNSPSDRRENRTSGKKDTAVVHLVETSRSVRRL